MRKPGRFMSESLSSYLFATFPQLWTVRTNECESTIDAHDDKIWALDISPCGNTLFSGGADSKIAVWRDTTREQDDTAREAEELNILMEQKLSNHLRNKQYEEALEIALKLEKPNQVLRVRPLILILRICLQADPNHLYHS